MDPTLQQYIDQARAEGKDENYIQGLVNSYNSQTGSQVEYEAPPAPEEQEQPLLGGLDLSVIPGVTESGEQIQKDTVDYIAPEEVKPYIAQAQAEGKDKEYIEGLVTAYYDQNPDKKPYFGDKAVYDDKGELSVVGGSFGKFLTKYGGGLWDNVEDLTLRPLLDGIDMREIATAVGDLSTNGVTEEEKERYLEIANKMQHNALASSEARDYSRYIQENGDSWGSAVLGAAKYPTVALASVFSSMVGMTNKYSLGIGAGTGAVSLAATGATGPIGWGFAIRNAFSAAGASMDGLVSLPDYIKEELEKDGIEPTEENLIKAIETKSNAFNRAQLRSLKRSGAIYGANMVTFAGANKIQKAVNPKLAGLNNRLKVAVKGAIETGIQVPGEGVGELAAQIAASEDVSPSEVVLEAFGGLGDVTISGVSDQFKLPMYGIQGRKNYTEKEFLDALRKASPEDFLSYSNIEIKNDANTQAEYDKIKFVKEQENMVNNSGHKVSDETKQRIIALQMEKQSLQDNTDPVSKDTVKDINKELDFITQEARGKKPERPEGEKPYKVDSKIDKYVGDLLQAPKAKDASSKTIKKDAVQQVQGTPEKGVLRDKGVDKKVDFTKTAAEQKVERDNTSTYIVDELEGQVEYKIVDEKNLDLKEGEGTESTGPATLTRLDLSGSKNANVRKTWKRFGGTDNDAEVLFMTNSALPSNVKGRFSIVERNGVAKPVVFVNPEYAKDGVIDEIVEHEAIGHMAKLAADVGIDAAKYGNLEQIVMDSSYGKAEAERIGDSIKKGTKHYSNEVFAGAVGKILAEDGNSSLAKRIWEWLKDYVKSALGNADAKARQKVRKFKSDVTKGKADVSGKVRGRAQIEGDLNLTGPAKKALDSEGRSDLASEIEALEKKVDEEFSKDGGNKSPHKKIMNAVLNAAKARMVADSTKFDKWNKKLVENPADIVKFQEYRLEKLKEELGAKVETNNKTGKEIVNDIIENIVTNRALKTDSAKRQKALLDEADREQVGAKVTDALINAENGNGSLIELVQQIGDAVVDTSFESLPIDQDVENQTEEEFFASNPELIQANTDAAFIGAWIVNGLIESGLIQTQTSFKTNTPSTFTIVNDGAVKKMMNEYGGVKRDVPAYKEFHYGKPMELKDYEGKLISNGKPLKGEKPRGVLKKYNSIRKKVDGELFGIIDKSIRKSKIYEKSDSVTKDKHERQMAPYEKSLATGAKIVKNQGKNGYTTAHNYDWRGRIYDMAIGFNVQSNKIAKGLTRFADETLVDDEGFKAILQQAVDTDVAGGPNGDFWAQDPADRIAEAKKRLNKWISDYEKIRKNPEANTELWDGADEPVIFLSTIAELYRMKKAGAIDSKGNFVSSKKFKSGLPIHMDATTSQGQQMAQLARDEKAAALVNMLSEGERQDFYLAVADETWGGFTYQPADEKKPAKEVPGYPIIEDDADLSTLKSVSSSLNKFNEDAKTESKKARDGEWKGNEEDLDKSIRDYYIQKAKDNDTSIEDAEAEAEERIAKFGKKTKASKKKKKGDTDLSKLPDKTDYDRLASKIFFKYAVADKYLWSRKNKDKFQEATNQFWGRRSIYNKRRKILKGPTMTQWYGAGTNTIQEALEKQFENDDLFNNPAEDIYFDWIFANDFVNKAFLANRNVFKGPAQLVEMLKKVTGYLNKNQGGQNLSYKLKFNDFEFEQEYRDPIIKRPTITNSDGSVSNISIAVGYKAKKNLDKARRSTAANVIHSFDSQIPAWLGVFAGYDFFSIHDNFATTPTESAQMYKDVRISMRDLYQGNALENWMREALTDKNGVLSEDAETFIQGLLNSFVDEEGNPTPYHSRPDFSGQMTEATWAFGAPPANPTGANKQPSTESLEDTMSTGVYILQEENLQKRKDDTC